MFEHAKQTQALAELQRSLEAHRASADRIVATYNGIAASTTRHRAAAAKAWAAWPSTGVQVIDDFKRAAQAERRRVAVAARGLIAELDLYAAELEQEGPN